MNGTLFVILETLAGVLVVVGARFVLVSAVAMHRQHDAISRINVLTPATGTGLPLIVVAAFLHRWAAVGFTWIDLLKTLVTVAALLIVSSVASNILARAAYLSGAKVSSHTRPQELAQEPDIDR